MIEAHDSAPLVMIVLIAFAVMVLVFRELCGKRLESGINTGAKVTLPVTTYGAVGTTEHTIQEGVLEPEAETASPRTPGVPRLKLDEVKGVKEHRTTASQGLEVKQVTGFLTEKGAEKRRSRRAVKAQGAEGLRTEEPKPSEGAKGERSPGTMGLRTAGSKSPGPEEAEDLGTHGTEGRKEIEACGVKGHGSPEARGPHGADGAEGSEGGKGAVGQEAEDSGEEGFEGLGIEDMEPALLLSEFQQKLAESQESQGPDSPMEFDSQRVSWKGNEGILQDFEGAEGLGTEQTEGFGVLEDPETRNPEMPRAETEAEGVSRAPQGSSPKGSGGGAFALRPEEVEALELAAQSQILDPWFREGMDPWNKRSSGSR